MICLLFQNLTDCSKTLSLHFPTVHFLDTSEYNHNFAIFSSQKNIQKPQMHN